jgi:hypothetical protein
MRAVITEKRGKSADNMGGKRELVESWVVVGIYKGALANVITCRAYMGRSASASTVYASIWISAGPRLVKSSDGDYISFADGVSGSGSAGGYGYHKVSAAIGDAIQNAGVHLFGDVYDGSNRYNYEEKRAYTPEELAARKKEADKKRAYISGVGDSAIEAALKAIAKAAGFTGKLIVIRN